MEIYTVQKIINLLNDMKITNMKGSKLYYSDIYSVIKKLKLSPVYVTQTENDHLLYWYSREQVDKIIKERLRIMKKRNVIKKQNTYGNQIKIEEKKNVVVIPEQEYLNCYTTTDILKMLKKEGITKNIKGTKLGVDDIRNDAKSLGIEPKGTRKNKMTRENLYFMEDVKKIMEKRRELYNSYKEDIKEIQSTETETIQAMGDVYDRLVSLEGKMDKLIQGVTQVHLCLIPEPQPSAPQPISEIKPEKKGFFARLFGRSGK